MVHTLPTYRSSKPKTTHHSSRPKTGNTFGPDGSRPARQPCRRPSSHTHSAVAGFPLNHRGRRRCGRGADADRLVVLLPPFPRASRASRRGGLVALLGGDRHLGTQCPRRLGVGHHELRVLGRDRARRNAHLGDPLPVPADMAHLDQPRGGGDDHLRGHVRDDIPGDPRRDAYGSPTGCSHSRTRWTCGPTSGVLCSGTSLRSACTEASRSCSGTSA